MMRSPRFFAVACRKPNGEIVVEQEPVENSILGKLKWLNKPFLRGTLALVDAMALGMKALNFSARVQSEGLPTAANDAPPVSVGTLGDLEVAEVDEKKSKKQARINDILIGGTMIFSFCFATVLFIAIPTGLTQLFQRFFGVTHPIALNVIDGVVRITIFLGYIALISNMENIRRVFQYHGAEHKAINTLEALQDLSVENTLAASRIHPRCGTSFIIIVLLAGIVVHSVLPRPENYFVRLGLHISLIPVVAGAAYEIIRVAGKYRHVALTTWLLAPGLWSQRLTTREPDASQCEVALAALNAVLKSERDHAKAQSDAIDEVEASAAASAVA